jgi:hypothetical protein
MKKSITASALGAAAMSMLLFSHGAVLADPGQGARKDSDRRACEEACRRDHRRWVDLCMDNHDPHLITPSARGQCTEAGSERLKACLRGCRE